MSRWRDKLVEQTWYGERKPGRLLGFLEHVYFRGFRLHQLWQRSRRAKHLEGKPIIVVGNLSAGGTGKTPFVIRLCELALDQGLNPAVISRGYGRTGNDPVRVKPGDNPRTSGDEPCLIANRTGVTVLVDRDRESAATRLLEEGHDVIISDDGLQRSRLPRRIEVCIRDRTRGYGNGRMLPAGPLREPVTRLERVDYIVEHLRHGIRAEASDGLTMQLKPGVITALHDNQTISAQSLVEQTQTLHAVAGIANPQRYFDTLDKLGLRFQRHEYPDHHRFSLKDFQSIPSGDTILMTEKDAVKCQKLPLSNAWYLPVDAHFSEQLETLLKRDLYKMAVSSGKRTYEP